MVDDDSDITDINVIDYVKYVTVKKRLSPHYCPLCGARMHSKGKFNRKPKHQILQDGYELSLTLIGRTCKCSDPSCSYSFADSFDFMNRINK